MESMRLKHISIRINTGVRIACVVYSCVWLRVCVCVCVQVQRIVFIERENISPRDIRYNVFGTIDSKTL